MDQKTVEGIIRIFDQYTPFQMAQMKQTVKNYVHRWHNTKDKLDALDHFFDIIDKSNQKFIESSPLKISCRKGCSFCCNIRVVGFQVEADYILEYCVNNNIKIDVERLELQAQNNDDISYCMSTYRRCVFLSDEGTCNIYEVRPSSCRNYMVTSPPERCNVDSIEGQQGTISAFNIGAALVQFALADILEHDNIAKLLLKSIKNGSSNKAVQQICSKDSTERSENGSTTIKSSSTEI